MSANPNCEGVASSANKIIRDYLVENVAVFEELQVLRGKGWDNPDGDAWFARQRKGADSTAGRKNDNSSRFFFEMMRRTGQSMASTGALTISRSTSDNPAILDLCMAPGGMLSMALQVNPGAKAIAFTLPEEDGGHAVLLPDDPRVEFKYLDVTLLGEDMGAADIPADHPDAARFLPRQVAEGKLFDLVLCDGQVLRTHSRAAYREQCESTRLLTAQLAIGMDHLRQGGTLIVLLHKVEARDTLNLLDQISKFAKITLFKPKKAHATRSSFYLIASDVQSDSVDAIQAVQEWKETWRIATFGTQEQYRAVREKNAAWAHALLEKIDPSILEKAKPIWRIQADALAKAPYIVNAHR